MLKLGLRSQNQHDHSSPGYEHIVLAPFAGAWEKRWQKSSWKQSEGSAGEFKQTAGKWYGDEKGELRTVVFAATLHDALELCSQLVHNNIQQLARR